MKYGSKSSVFNRCAKSMYPEISWPRAFLSRMKIIDWNKKKYFELTSCNIYKFNISLKKCGWTLFLWWVILHHRKYCDILFSKHTVIFPLLFASSLCAKARSRGSFSSLPELANVLKEKNITFRIYQCHIHIWLFKGNVFATLTYKTAQLNRGEAFYFLNVSLCN